MGEISRAGGTEVQPAKPTEIVPLRIQYMQTCLPNSLFLNMSDKLCVCSIEINTEVSNGH